MKSNVTRIIAIAAMAGAATVMISGCSVARKQETVGQYIDGSAVTAEDKAKLANDPDTSAANISVKTIDAGVVQLSGFAKNSAEKAKAEDLARNTSGVKSVRNDIVIRP